MLMKITAARTARTASVAVLATGLVSCGFEDQSVKLSGIEDAMWESMWHSSSVTVTAEVPGPDEQGGTGLITSLLWALGDTAESYTTYGALDLSAAGATRVIDGEVQDVLRTFQGVTYKAPALQIDEHTRGLRHGPEFSPEPYEAMATEYEGDWMELDRFDEILEPGTPPDLIHDLRTLWYQESTPDQPVNGAMHPENLSAWGEPENRDGVDVWVFSSDGEDVELAVEADVDRPRILSIRDHDLSLTFSDWDSTALPTKPDADNYVDESRVYEQLNTILKSTLD